MSGVRVKICGITRLEDVASSVRCGADALGFVFTERSPRCVTTTEAAELLLRRALAILRHAHPEGHPVASDEELLEQLLAKQEYANYLVTQMCFDAARIERWRSGTPCQSVARKSMLRAISAAISASNTIWPNKSPRRPTS